MNNNIKLRQLIIIILLINAAGYLLKYFELPDYFILLGFRFHLTAVVLFFFIFKLITAGLLKSIFIKATFPNKSVYLLTLLLPVLITAAAAYFVLDAELGEPDYFYEFGLSSIVDFPLYLIWNFPQISILFLFFYLTGGSYFKTFGLAVLLFIYIFIPVDFQSFNYIEPAAFILTAAAVSVIYCKYKNVYLFAFFLFLILWGVNLAFGTGSERIVNLIFAANYAEWEGFFVTAKKYSSYVVPGYFGVVFLSSLINIPLEIDK